MVEKKILWDDASRAGLVLGGISVAYMACNALLGKLTGDRLGINILVNVLSFFLWAVKFGACIYLVRFFMLRFVRHCPEADNRDSFRFGTMAALLSALIYSAFYLAWTTFIEPDMFQQVADLLEGNLQAVATTAQTEQMREILPKMPTYGFFINLIYCWIFGTIVAAIFSHNIPSRNPFKDN